MNSNRETGIAVITLLIATVVAMMIIMLTSCRSTRHMQSRVEKATSVCSSGRAFQSTLFDSIAKAWQFDADSIIIEYHTVDWPDKAQPATEGRASRSPWPRDTSALHAGHSAGATTVPYAALPTQPSSMRPWCTSSMRHGRTTSPHQSCAPLPTPKARIKIYAPHAAGSCSKRSIENTSFSDSTAKAAQSQSKEDSESKRSPSPGPLHTAALIIIAIVIAAFVVRRLR